MGSPVSFSGFNQIDFGVVLNAVMQQESAPVVALEVTKAEFTAKKAEYASLATKVADLETAVGKLDSADAFGARTSTNTDITALTVTAGTSATTGTYDIVVNELARAQVTASNSTHSDKDTTIVATGGTLTIGGTAVAISSGVTLEGLSDAINSTSGIGVTATVVSPSAGSFQLVLTGNDTGAANSFLITNTLTGGTEPVTFIDTDTDSTSGDDPADNAVQATDSVVVVNNITITSATNSVDTAISGATLDLLKKDTGSTITVTISEDTEATKTLVDEFVTAFNSLESFADEQITAAGAGNNGTLARDPLLRSLLLDIRSGLTSSYAVGGAYQYATEVGLGFTVTGELEFTKATYDTAAKTALADIQKLFVGGGGQDGAFKVLSDQLKSYTQADGLLPEAQRRNDDQVDRLSDRISAYEDRLALRRAALQRQFIATDLAISGLNNAVKSLSSLNGQFRLF
jgi:flagellar hook-associated protein 2